MALSPFMVARQLIHVRIVLTVLVFIYLLENAINIRIIIRMFLTSLEELKILFWGAFVLYIFTTLVVNIISMKWALLAKEADKLCFVSHVFQCGLLWWCYSLWVKQDPFLECQCLSNFKLMFSYMHTIPFIIIQLYSVYHGEATPENYVETFTLVGIEVFLVVLTVACICWTAGRETSNNSRLIRTSTLRMSTLQVPLEEKNGDDNNTKQKVYERKPANVINSDHHTDLYCKCVVMVQMTTFQFGRLVTFAALPDVVGFLCIIFVIIDWILNVAYLKYFASHLTVDYRRKHRQWFRLGFIGFLLLFDWHINRDCDTLYNLHAQTKSGLMYYIIKAAESVIILALWMTKYHDLQNDNAIRLNPEQRETAYSLALSGTISVIVSLFLLASLILHMSDLSVSESTIDHSVLQRIYGCQNKLVSNTEGGLSHRFGPFWAPWLTNREPNSHEIHSSDSYVDFKDLDENIVIKQRRKMSKFRNVHQKSVNEIVHCSVWTVEVLNNIEKSFTTCEENKSHSDSKSIKHHVEIALLEENTKNTKSHLKSMKGRTEEKNQNKLSRDDHVKIMDLYGKSGTSCDNTFYNSQTNTFLKPSSELLECTLDKFNKIFQDVLTQRVETSDKKFEQFDNEPNYVKINHRRSFSDGCCQIEKYNNIPTMKTFKENGLRYTCSSFKSTEVGKSYVVSSSNPYRNHEEGFYFKASKMKCWSVEDIKTHVANFCAETFENPDKSKSPDNESYLQSTIREDKVKEVTISEYIENLGNQKMYSSCPMEYSNCAFIQDIEGYI